MRSWSALVLVLALGGLQEKPTPPQEPRPPVFRTEANFVRVDAYPTKDGRPVLGLGADDFELLEDGVRQRIESFEHVRIQTGTPPEARIEPASPREAERLAANPRNRVFVIYLDVPHVQVASSHAIKQPLINLFGRMMGPDDLVAIMTPGMSATQLTFARRTQVFESELTEHWIWGHRDRMTEMDEREKQYDFCYPPAPGEPGPRSALANEVISRRRERMVLESLYDLVNYLGGLREERKAIITVTEGWRLYGPNQAVMRMRDGEPVPGTDNIGVGPDGRLRRNPPTTRTENISSRYECDTDRMALAAMDNERYFRDLLDVANRANASFYPVDPRGLPASDDVWMPGRALPSPIASQRMLSYKLDRLRELAENTDGLAILNSNDLDRGLKRVSDDLTSYYLLGYYSSNPKLDGGFRSLKVRVKRDGVEVRARRGYRAATAAEVTAAREAAAIVVPEETKAVADAIAGLARERGDVPFIVRATAGDAGAGGMSAVWVAGELRGREVPQGGSVAIDVSGAGPSAGAKAELKPGERGFLVRVPLAAPAAEADVRARWTPASGAAAGAGTYAVRVAAPAGLPQPVLYKRGLSTGNRLQPAAGLEFSRAERLRLEVPLADGTKPAGATLLDRNAQALPVPVAVSERTDAASGQRWLTADVTLAPLGAGDYAIEIAATTAAGTQKVVTAIRVTR